MPAEAISVRGKRRLVLGLVLAGLLALVFGLRVGIAALHWSERRETDVQGWMTIGFVAHSWQVDRELLEAALGDAAAGRATLDEIAARTGRPPSEVVTIVERTIAEAGR